MSVPVLRDRNADEHWRIMVNRALMAGKSCRLRQPLPHAGDLAVILGSRNCSENQHAS
jgi:hypothetical protein